ncbi:hypothetical protein HOLleu_26075 [Holothuria leucospilota]|uniref:RNA-directed DNA polymerase n=1 Tax=Holothuria leucospilota TaxID=206669 RepID=A0A9Q1BTY6_HOLLE|nr:hypothetical protein HOLleu_26075 [Holothuria leucospilota]
MAVFGKIGSFLEHEEKFEDYADRVEAFIAANNIEAARKTIFFLATVGAPTYKLLKDAENESVSDYIVRLKNLSSQCKFGAFLKEALRDKLVSGLHSKMKGIQTKLLSMEDLTFETAKTKCIASELASQASKDHMGSVPEADQTGTQDHTANKVAHNNKTSSYNKDRPRPNYNASRSQRKCIRCGGNHPTTSCWHQNTICFDCKERGHIQRVCPRRKNKQKGNRSWGKYATSRFVHSMESEDSEDDQAAGPTGEEIAECFGLYYTDIEEEVNTVNDKHKPFLVDLQVAGQDVQMEVDTGASRSTISEHVYKAQFASIPLYETKVTLRSYSGENVPLLGSIKVPVSYKGSQAQHHELLVVKGKKPSLFGRDLLEHVKLDWANIFTLERFDKGKSVSDLQLAKQLKELLKTNESVFEASKVSSGIKGFTASLKLKDNAKPVFQKDRPVPYALVSQAEKEYDRLRETGIFKPIDTNDWASPVVHIEKLNGTVRVCGDYKALNDCIEDDNYKLPNIQSLLARLAKDSTKPKYFSTLDLTGAFNQLPLDENSAKLLVLNTHKGLYMPTRLCYGVKTAPAQFQATMDKILSGLENVCCYIDDILVATETPEENLRVLGQVFNRLNKYNVILNKEKCEFLKKTLNYLGHQIKGEGVSPIQSRVSAVLRAKRPSNVSELRSFLGMLNYYGKFIHNLATLVQPLYALLNRDAQWYWSRACEEAFVEAKKILTSSKVLAHYDASKTLVLSVDASPVGVGAVRVSHRYPDGSERPIAYASRTLSPAERNYAQIEKEALAIIYGIKKFHLYVYGRKFVLVTDHQPLTRIFGPKAGIPALAAARMQRWALILSGYQYTIVYRSSVNNANADMLSRLPAGNPEEADPDENYVFQTMVGYLPVKAKDISHKTSKDPVLSRVYDYTLSGWPGEVDAPALEPYYVRREELTIEGGCVLWGRKVIIPEGLQGRILDELHETHQGMCKMKALARSFVWWPGIDQDIEQSVRECSVCVEMQSIPKKEPLLLWPWATTP